jgi:hypothetical protein
MHRGLQGAVFQATTLAAVRRRGWAQSIGEREPGVVSVSAPVRGPGNRVVAAVSVSGPVDRLSRQPGRLHANAVVAAADKLTEALRRGTVGKTGDGAVVEAPPGRRTPVRRLP